MSSEQKTPAQNRVAVVTGSSSGIGKAIALQMATDGFDVIVHANNNTDGAETVAEEICKLGRQALLIQQDFSETAELESFVDQCWSWKSRIDTWVNNAGADVLTGKAANWDFVTRLNRVLQVDVVATLVLSRAIGQRMAQAKKAGGNSRCSIINIGWDQAANGMAGESGEMFAASKGAIMAMSKSLAQSLAPTVRVNCIAPGWIQTAWGDDASSKWHDRARRESLSDRWGQPRDIAAAASFLASDKASFVHGQVFNVNGGFRFGCSE